MPKKRNVEKKDYINPNWLKHQYYELNRSIQDIADDQNVNMVTIRKKLDILEKPVSIKEELKPKKPNHVPSISMEKEGNPIIKCLNCGHQLSFGAKFCVNCGGKVEGTQLGPPLQEKEEEVPETEVPKIKIEEIKAIPAIKENEVETPIAKTSIKIGEVQTTALISDKKEKKLKKIPSTCKFCGMTLNPEASFCPQCGTILKKK
jgi:uncharacterized OB-fold protein